MTELVQWLRYWGPNYSPKLIEAADEIERLLAGRDNLRMEITALLHIADRDEAEIKRLREENGRLDSHNKELLYDNEQKFAEIQRLQEQVLALQHIADRDEAEIERLRAALTIIKSVNENGNSPSLFLQDVIEAALEEK
jgi:chromosome segregation ATPase